MSSNKVCHQRQRHTLGFFTIRSSYFKQYTLKVTGLKVASLTEYSMLFARYLHLGLPSLGKKATIHQQTTMLSTSKSVVFPGHNHLLITNADDPSLLIITLAGAWAIDNQTEGSSAPVVSRWLWPGNRTFLEVASMVDCCFFVLCYALFMQFATYLHLPCRKFSAKWCMQIKGGGLRTMYFVQLDIKYIYSCTAQTLLTCLYAGAFVVNLFSISHKICITKFSIAAKPHHLAAILVYTVLICFLTCLVNDVPTLHWDRELNSGHDFPRKDQAVLFSTLGKCLHAYKCLH